MARDIVLDLVANDDTSSVLKRVSREFDALAAEVDQASMAAGRSAGEFDKTRVSIQHMERVIASAKSETRGLREEFARTGDVDVFARIRNNDRIIRDLERVRRGLADVLPDPEPEGQGWGSRLGMGMLGGIQSGLQGLPLGIGRAMTGAGSAAAPVVVGVGIALAGTLLIAMSGALMAGAGAMGIAAGIMSAAKDPVVAKAIDGLKKTMVDQFADIGKPFGKPLLDSIAIVKREIGSLDLAGAIRPLADAVVPLTRGGMGMIRNMMPGLRAFFESAKLVLRDIAAQLPGLGRALSTMFKDISTAGPAAVTVFRALFMVIEATAITIGMMVKIAAAGMALFGDNTDKAAFAVALVNSELEKGKKGGAELFKGMDESARSAAAGVDQLIESLDEMRNRVVGVMESESAYQAAIDEVEKSISAHGRTLNLDTEAGRANQQVLIDMANAARKRAQAIYDDTYATLGSAAATDKARDAWEQGRQKVIASALAMGQSAAAAEDLANKIMGVPPSRSTDVTANTGNAQAAIQRFSAAVNSIDRNVTVHVNAIQSFGPGIGVRERGGPVRAGMAYVVGEKQPELFIPESDGTILPAVPPVTSGISFSRGGDGAAMRPITLTVYAGWGADGRQIGADVVRALQDYERVNGTGWRA